MQRFVHIGDEVNDVLNLRSRAPPQLFSIQLPFSNSDSDKIPQRRSDSHCVRVGRRDSVGELKAVCIHHWRVCSVRADSRKASAARSSSRPPNCK